jgi:hypothetical protein
MPKIIGNYWSPVVASPGFIPFYNHLIFFMKKTFLFLGFLLSANFIFAQYWTASGNNIYNTLPGYVGIGTAPSCPLDVAGMIHSSYSLVIDQAAGANIGGWFRGAATGSGNIVVQGGGGTWQAYWITGANGYMKIGGSGGAEPGTGAINVDNTGNVGVGTLNTSSYKFSVAGSAVFDAVTVKLITSTNPKGTSWADYVFDKNYQLPTLASVANYIKQNGHLPGIPTAAQVEKNGLDLGATQTKLLEKIEQLTLYTIDLQKQADQSRATVGALQQQVEELKKIISQKNDH